MNLQEQLPGDREQELRKLIRSLSKVSEVETREIRANIEREGRMRNRNRRRRAVEEDGLLRQRRVVLLPNLLSSHRLFESKDRKVESLKERYIDSQAFLKRANFESKKIQLKKQDIAHKQYRGEHAHASATKIELASTYTLEHDPFLTPNVQLPEPVDPLLIERLKTTVNSSHKEMKSLYQSHVRQVASLPFRRRIVSDHAHSDVASVASRDSDTSGPLIKPTKSVILLPSARRPKKVVDELIKMSRSRAKQAQPSNEPTAKEQEQQLQTEGMIMELQEGIEVGNKLKESIVLGQLKKLLYGDRRGRFIQDSTFRTRLRGEYSEQYMNVVQEQQTILSAFNGSYFNRRNLVEKFANILGTLRVHTSPEEHVLALT